MRKLFLLLTFLLPLACFAQIDQPITLRSGTADLFRTRAWNSSGAGGFANNYIINLPNTDAGVCFNLTNLDSSVHSFTLGASVTADPLLTTYTGNTNSWIPVVNTTGAIAKLVKGNTQNNTFSQFFKYAGGVRLVLSLAGGSGSGNVSAFITSSTQGGCGTTPFFNSLSTSEFTSAAITNGSAYASSACVTNPTLNQNILSVSWSNSVARSRVFFHQARMSTSAAGQLWISAITTSGTTCTTPVAVQSPLTAAATQAATITSACTGSVPTVAGEIDDEVLAAGIPASYDLQGYWISSSTIQGIEVRAPAAITGTVCASISWSELP